MKLTKTFSVSLMISLVIFGCIAHAQITLNTPGVESKLYMGRGKLQPLLVGLGGSEGGNAWASDRWATVRNEFLEQGYAFLALGYFQAPGAPDTLDRIAIDRVHDAIAAAARQPGVDRKKIAVIGGSRGGDLALLLGSHYKDIGAVVAIVPSHVAFPGHTDHMSTSAWSYKGNDLPFVPVSEEAIPNLVKRDLRGAFEVMLRDTLAEERAAIQVEKINGPILLLSATRDEYCPSTEMCNKMIERLKSKKFGHFVDHVAIEGSHAEPLKHFNLVTGFLKKRFYDPR